MKALVLRIAQLGILFLLIKLFVLSIHACLTVPAAIASSKNASLVRPLIIFMQAHVLQAALLLLRSRQVHAKTILRA